MFVIPELRKVVVMPPRSGSTSLRRALAAKYDFGWSPYRHAEVSMLKFVRQIHPAVDDYGIVYILRDPMDRMISLWRYMQSVNRERNSRAPEEWINRVRTDASRPFQDWLLNSTELFNESAAHPLDGSPQSHYCTAWNVPAAQKDARWFLRGAQPSSVEICRFGDTRDYQKILGLRWDVDIIRDNTTEQFEASYNVFGRSHIQNYHATDLILMGLK